MGDSRYKILVAGGDGFLGSHMVDRLVADGHAVTVLDRFPDNRARHLGHLEGRVRLVSGDRAARETAAEALKGQDVVYDFVCATNPAVSWNDIPLEIEQNLLPAIQFFELAAEAGVRKLVFVSSGGTVYGPAEGAVDETRVPQPVNPYGIVKLACEHFLRHFRAKRGLAYDVYRVANAYGPRQSVTSAQGVVAVWMRQILDGEILQVRGDEKTVRDYVFVGDIARLMTHSLRDLSSSDTYNLGTGRGTSIVDLLDIFRRVVEVPFRFERKPRQPSDAVVSTLDSRKLLQHYPGFRFADLDEKMRETWQDFRARHRRAEDPKP